MKKYLCFTVIAALLVTILFMAGCGSGEGGGGEVDKNQPVDSVLLGGCTVNNNGTIDSFIYSVQASSHNIKNNSPRTLTLPDSFTVNYNVLTGPATADLYYFGNSLLPVGPITDPFSETTQRQLYAYRKLSAMHHGIYTIESGLQAKDVLVPQGNFLAPLNINNISTQAGPGLLRVVVGDTITLSGQTDPNLRYFCRIFDTAKDPSGSSFQRLWTYADVRDFNWKSTQNVKSFFMNNTKTASGGSVSFTIPPLALQTAATPDNLRVIITAYDISLMEPDTSGAFETMVFPISEMVFYLRGI
jgi:hypothetical protein